MQLPGEYAQPLTRNTEVRIPVIAGLVTSRLRSCVALANGTTFADSATQALIKNTGNTQVTLQFQETDDYVDGPFTATGGAVTIKPLGQVTTTIYPKQAYLELKGLTGTGAVNVRLSSQIQFKELAFDKTDGRSPSSLWQANLQSWSSL